MPKITKQTMRPRAKAGSPQDAWDMTDYLSLLLYGESGTGKTTTWSSFPDPILCIVCSGGKKPGELRSIKTKENMDRITARICNTGDQFQSMLEEAQGGEYQTVVVDHVTGLADMFLREEMGVEELPQQKSWGMATKDHYQAMALRVKEALHRVLSLDCHRVIVAQEKNHNEKYEGSDEILKPVIGAAVSASVIKWLNPACDYILQTFKRPRMEVKKTKVAGAVVERMVKTEGIEYCARCQPHEYYITKFRVPKGSVLPDVIVDPSYEKILAVINGE